MDTVTSQNLIPPHMNSWASYVMPYLSRRSRPKLLWPSETQQ